MHTLCHYTEFSRHREDPAPRLRLIPGLAFLFDAARGITLNGSDVSAWADQSGRQNHLAQASAALQPVYTASNPHFGGKPSVDFHKSAGEYLFGSALPICTAMSGSDKPLTVFAVVRRSTKVSAEEIVFSLGNSGSGTVSYLSAGYVYGSSNSQRLRFRMRDDAGTAETTLQGLNELTDLGPQILVFELSGTEGRHYVVGNSQNPHYDSTVATNTTVDYSGQGAITFDRFALGALLRSTATLPAELELAACVGVGRDVGQAERTAICDFLWRQYCDVPSPITGVFPARLLSGIAHLWSAETAIEDDGEQTSALTDAVGGKSFLAGGSARPTVRLHENGRKVLEFDGVANAMTAGVVADWRFLHDGSDFSIFVVYRVLDGDEALHPIVDTLANDTANVGFGMYHDGASAAHSLQIKIGNDTTAVLNHDSQDYGVRPDAWHVAHLTRENSIPSSEENFQVWLDNENYAASDQAATPIAATDPQGTLTLGALTGGGTFGKFQFAEMIVYSRKLGRPGDSQLVCEALAAKWNTSHVALAAGNGLANLLNDTQKHRGFPALCQDAAGAWHCVYRRGSTHGSSRGVGVHVTSLDGIRWSAEHVIYDIDDDDGRDFRSGASMICLRSGPHAGRLLISTNWAADDSSLEVPGFGSTNLIGLSDDSGTSWTWFNPQENDPKNVYENPWDYTVTNAAAMIELSTGRIVMTFTSKDASQDTNNQDLNLAYSDDGGETWSDSVIIYTHDGALGTDKRITESWIVEWDDGDLSMFVRNDTDKEIWRATANIADVTDWTFDVAKLFDGWGRPMAIRDPNAAAGLFMFHRSDPGDVSVWRYSADEGATWTAARAYSNLHATTTIVAYNEMSYCYAAVDGDGNVWVASGMEAGDDSDIFVRRWALKI